MTNQTELTVDVPRLLRIHWLWALVLSFFTLGIFGAVLFIVQADWVWRVQGTKLSLVLSSALAGVNFLLLALRVVPLQTSNGDITDGYGPLLSTILWIASVYILRGALTEEPIGLTLGWIMPLLYGPIYFQYHIQDYGSSASSGRPLGLNR